MNKIKNTNKGITLIALVITIIVMLILVAVTISMAVNGGLFEMAERAASQTEAEKLKEQELANAKININNTIYNSIEEYTQQWVGPAKTLIELWKAGKLERGAYVDYRPNGATSYNPDDPQGTGGEAGTLTGYTETAQNIKREKLNWRIYTINENEIILIPTSPTKEEIYFYGRTGWQNYEDVLDATCKKLYSNSSIGAVANSGCNIRK